VFDGYWRRPDATDAALAPGGWLRTGDLGALDADGRLRFHGRAKDVLKVGGENVSALEVESHLARHPAVKLAQVIGRPDARLGEVPVAFVETRPGREVAAAALVEHCRAGLASFKVPREVRFVTEWPMSSTKIQKYRLREQLGDAAG
jgi:acyl-CoA synthetase (AMP-forming)/AMP-acid ligase II